MHNLHSCSDGAYLITKSNWIWFYRTQKIELFPACCRVTTCLLQKQENLNLLGKELIILIITRYPSNGRNGNSRHLSVPRMSHIILFPNSKIR